MKLVIQQAILDYNSIQSRQERKTYLIQKSPLFAKDKTGCQILQK